MLSNLITILVALLVFAVMVVVHEFGHFATAKLFKINVVEFAVGMGPAIFKKKRGETTYSIRCLPLGGYCMFDEDVGNPDAPNAFEKAAWWKRLCVVLAGAFLNIVLGFLIFAILQSAKPTTYQPVITSFVENTQMEAAGFQAGDEIVRLNDTQIHVKDDIDFFMLQNGAKPIVVTAKRGKETVQATVKPSKYEERYTFLEDRLDVVAYVEGKEIERETRPAADDEEYKQYIGETATASKYLIGFVGTEPSRTLGSVLHDAFFTTIYNVKIVYFSLFELICGNVTADQVSGPIGIVSVIGQATKIGWMTLLSLVGLLTVNLGIMNLLPIPGLDGCKAITTVIEAIVRKKLPQKAEIVINIIGFSILILIMLFATFNDIRNLFNPM